MITRSRIENYFEDLEVDTFITKEETGFVVTFNIDYSCFTKEIILDIDENNIKLSLIFSSVDINVNLLEAINEFNIYSKYYKAFYNPIREEIVIETNQFFQNNKFEEILELSLNSLVNLDSEYIEKIYELINKNETIENLLKEELEEI